MADRGQGFDFPEPEAFGPQSVSDPFAPGTEGTPEPGDERGALEVAEPVNEPRMLGRDKTQVQAGYAEQESMVNQEAIAAENARMEEELQWQEALQDEATMQAGVDDVPANEEEAGKPARESKTTKAFLSGTILTCLFPPYGVYKLMKPYIVTDKIHASIIIVALPPIEMMISALMMKNALKYSDEYAPLSPGKKTIASAFMTTVPWIWWALVAIALIALLVMMILVSMCEASWVSSACYWYAERKTGISIQ